MRVATALPLMLGLVGCGQPMVEGSLGALASLYYTKATVAADSSNVVLRFILVRDDKLSLVEKDCPLEDTVLQVTARIGGLALKPALAMPVDLTQTAPGGGQRGLVSRTICSKVTQLPALQRGQLTLNPPPSSQTPWKTGQKVTGSFSVTFIDGTGTFDGRTAYSSFEAQAQ